MPKVSVIIPCYNQGEYLEESVGSVQLQTFTDYEIIIINDGSTCELSCDILSTFSKPKTKVIHTENQGLAAARNNGIDVASGEYILPLDADDRIDPEYIDRAVDILDNRPELGIVYCRARLFGDVETEWILPSYSKAEMLKDNIIFCSAFFRRTDWQLVGGYDTGMIYGWEDYEFWLSLIEQGREVYQIPEILFSYRISSKSMIRTKERWHKVEMFKRIFRRHNKLFSDNIDVWINSILDIKDKSFTSRLYVDSGGGFSGQNSLCRNVQKGTSEISFKLDGLTNIKALCFSPVDAPVVLEIFCFILHYNDGRTVECHQYNDNAILKDEKYKYFNTSAPQFFLDISANEFIDLKSLSVCLRFKDFCENALSVIVQQQNVKLLNTKSKMQYYENIGAIKSFVLFSARRKGESILKYLKRQVFVI